MDESEPETFQRQTSARRSYTRLTGPDHAQPVVYSIDILISRSFITIFGHRCGRWRSIDVGRVARFSWDESSSTNSAEYGQGYLRQGVATIFVVELSRTMAFRMTNCLSQVSRDG